MNIVINTDASFSSKHKRGTYAFYINTNTDRISKSGALRKKCLCSSEAEIKTIINALAFVYMDIELFSKCKTIHVDTDSMNALHLWKKDAVAIKKYRLNKLNQQFAAKIQSAKDVFKDKKITLRYVKAHTNVNFANDFCDKMARKEMSLLIKKLENK